MANEFDDRVNEIQSPDQLGAELGPDAKLEATIAFASMADDIYLRHIDAVQTIKERPPNPLTGEELTSGVYKLELRSPLDEESQLRVVVSSWTGDYRQPDYDKEIQVQRLDRQGFTRRACRYYIDGDEVRRYDVDDAALMAATIPSRILHIDIVPSNVKSDLSLQELEETDDLANMELESQTGFNDQPVSPGEVAKLANLISDAKPLGSH